MGKLEQVIELIARHNNKNNDENTHVFLFVDERGYFLEYLGYGLEDEGVITGPHDSLDPIIEQLTTKIDYSTYTLEDFIDKIGQRSAEIFKGGGIHVFHSEYGHKTYNSILEFMES